MDTEVISAGDGSLDMDTEVISSGDGSLQGRTGIGSAVVALREAVDGTRPLLASAAVAARRGELHNKPLEGFLKEMDREVFRADTLLDELDYHRILVQQEACAAATGEQVGYLVSPFWNLILSVFLSIPFLGKPKHS
jgi:hypothetical protein